MCVCVYVYTYMYIYIYVCNNIYICLYKCISMIRFCECGRDKETTNARVERDDRTQPNIWKLSGATDRRLQDYPLAIFRRS